MNLDAIAIMLGPHDFASISTPGPWVPSLHPLEVCVHNCLIKAEEATGFGISLRTLVYPMKDYMSRSFLHVGTLYWGLYTLLCYKFSNAATSNPLGRMWRHVDRVKVKSQHIVRVGTSMNR